MPWSVIWYYRCKSCEHEWIDSIKDARFCPSCRGRAHLYGMKLVRKGESPSGKEGLSVRRGAPALTG